MSLFARMFGKKEIKVPSELVKPLEKWYCRKCDDYLGEEESRKWMYNMEHYWIEIIGDALCKKCKKYKNHMRKKEQEKKWKKQEKAVRLMAERQRLEKVKWINGRDKYLTKLKEVNS